MRDSIAVTAMALTGALAWAGCGSDGEETTTPSKTATVPTTTRAETTTAPEPTTVVDQETGPTSCGENSKGMSVVVNSGTISCTEAIQVSENSSGPNEATGPPGWDCSQFAETLKGSQVIGANGFGCARDSGTRISFYVSDSSSEAAVQDCGDGLDQGIQAFDVSARGVSCDVAFNGIRQLMEVGYAEGASIGGGFVCRSLGQAGVEASVWRCVNGAQAFRFTLGA